MKRHWRDALLALGAVVVVGLAATVATFLYHRNDRCVRDHLEPMYFTQPNGNVVVLYTRVCDEWEREP